MNEMTVFAICGALFIIMLMVLRWRWKQHAGKYEREPECPPCPAHVRAQFTSSAPIVHRLCPHLNVIQSYPLENKDSIDEHLNILTKKLAEKEGRLRLSKSKIRQTQQEIENLQAIDQDVKFRYREIMENLKSDLLSNEQECKKLQDQIEWVSRRRAELREEVRRGQRMYGEAAAELANNLAEIQRGRGYLVTDKPASYLSDSSVRHRKEPSFPKMDAVGSVVIKSPVTSTPSPETNIRLNSND